MNNPWVITILGGIVVAVIGLFIEYKVFQNEHLQSREIKGSEKGWNAGINKATRQVKRQIGEGMFEWIKTKYVITVDKVEKGRALITVEVVDKEYERVKRRYRLIIDRTGDILEMKPISRYDIDNSSYTNLLRDILFQNKDDDRPANHNSPPKIVEVKGPIKEVSAGQIQIYIEFVVENLGQATQIYPYFEFKVAILKDKGLSEELIRSEPEIIDIDAHVKVRYRRGRVFPITTIMHVPEQKPRVELFPPPNTTKRT